MAPAEVEAVAALHRRCFHDYRSTRLGGAYCRRMLRAYATRPDSWVAVAVGGSGRIDGYLVAAPPATQRAVDRALLPWAALHALAHPVALADDVGPVVRRLRRLARRNRATGLPAGPSPEDVRAGAAPHATIRVVLVGVDPTARGGGAVDRLLACFATAARDRGHLVADLSVAADNLAAQRAYARNGWAPDAEGRHFLLDLSGTSRS
jgi:ribosomal protein S18 acetylase RimI-like enzyme